MKRLARTALFVSSITVAATANAAGANGPYEIKSGMVETTTAMFGTSTTTEYFDDYGVKSAKYTTTTVMGETTHQLQIHLPDGSSYDIDLDKKTGTVLRIPPEQAQMMAAAMAPHLTKDAKVKNLGAKDLLGKKCDGKQYEAMGMTTRMWAWKGIPLYTEAGEAPNPMIIRATKVSEEPVAADKFKVPAGIKIQNIGN